MYLLTLYQFAVTVFVYVLTLYQYIQPACTLHIMWSGCKNGAVPRLSSGEPSVFSPDTLSNILSVASGQTKQVHPLPTESLPPSVSGCQDREEHTFSPELELVSELYTICRVLFLCHKVTFTFCPHIYPYLLFL